MSRKDAGFPWYFAIESRLVKVVATKDGGMDVLVFNPETKALERDLAYLAQCFDPGQNVDRLTEADFNARIQTLSEQ
jgi:hypothetical protein